MTFGTRANKQTWYNPPYTVEDRLDSILKPLLESIRKDTGRTPDLTYVNSGLWDLHRFAGQDLKAGGDVEEGLSL